MKPRDEADLLTSQSLFADQCAVYVFKHLVIVEAESDVLEK
jgi:hypothetical protein